MKDNLYSEIKILEKLRHPHIVALHECIETPSYIHLMMEYCALGDLSQFIKNKARDEKMAKMALADVRARYPTPRSGGVNEVLIRHFLKQLASALEFLRLKNLIHRDVKPQNLLLLPPPTWQEANPDVQAILSASYDSLIPATGIRSLPMLKLADFGFARVLPATSLAETLCGSPLYMAPEILRYERYDAKADLWSVGTVLYELTTGRPPFRASNHVDLLRQIERIDNRIEFPSNVDVSPELKDVILALLKKNPLERISFEEFFKHEVVTGPIPGLVEEDMVASVESKDAKRGKAEPSVDETGSAGRKLPLRRYGTEQDLNRAERVQSSPVEKPYRRSPLSTPTAETDKQLGQPATRLSHSPRQDMGEGLGIRRPQPVSSTSAPPKSYMHEARRRAISNASANKHGREGPVTGLAESPRSRSGAQAGRITSSEQEQTQQDIAFERDYVVVDKNQVAVNALADELAANGRMALLTQGHSAPSGQMVRRTTTQGAPDSTTGAIAPLPSRAMQIAQGRPRSNTYERRPSLGSKPASFITKAIHGASNRWLSGIKLPTDFGKGGSPPQLYNPFPTYSVQPAPIALIGDGKQSAPYDEDARVAQRIEDFATRSDVVYGFAEVKYKQLVPLTPSMDHGLGGVPSDTEAPEGEDVLTVDAIIALSEEALALYVKALSLLAKAMDIANLWWTRKTRSESSGNHPAGRDPSSTQALLNRINSAVQWVRTRFNEVLEKAEIVRLKLNDAQRGLPEDHPNHPSNRPEATSTSFSTGDRANFTPGIVAEKLMYERAVDMSRRAAIDEIANGDLAGCEISYVTAICMLEAVLDKDEDLPKRRISGVSKDETTASREEPTTSELDSIDQQAVIRCKLLSTDVVWNSTDFFLVIGMVTSRLAAVRSKMQMVASATRAQQQQQNLVRRRSGDASPRSSPAHG